MATKQPRPSIRFVRDSDRTRFDSGERLRPLIRWQLVFGNDPMCKEVNPRLSYLTSIQVVVG